MRDLQAAEKPHAQRVKLYDQMDAVWHAQNPLREQSNRSTLFPRYVYQIIETFRANIVDDLPTLKITPSQPGYEDGAEAHECLIRAQRRLDRFPEKVNRYALQALIRGVSPAKVHWLYEERKIRCWKDQPVLDPFTQQPQVGADGQPVSKLVEGEDLQVTSRPSFTPWDAKDFLWDPAATTTDDWQFVFARTWDTLDSLKAAGGSEPVYKNLDQLAENPGAGAQQAQTVAGAASMPDRDVKGRVEVWERWTRDRLTVVANRKVVIRDEPNPFWHGEIPFILGTPVEDLFTLDGLSIALVLRDIQKALWKLGNQVIDNAELMCNYDVYFQSGTLVEEEQLEDKFTGRIMETTVPPGQAVWSPPAPVNIVQPAMESIAQIRGDMVDIVGAVPYVSGAAQETVDQTTATGISITQNMAQKRLLAVKRQLGWALERAGYQWLKLNQQLVTKPQVLLVEGDGYGSEGADWKTVTPQSLMGEYQFELEDMEESLNRQERRQEALLLFNTLVQAANTPALQGQINVRPLAEDLAEAFDKAPDAFLNPVAAPMLGAPGVPMGVPAGGGVPGSPPTNGAPPAPPTPPATAGAGSLAPPLTFPRPAA